MYTAQESVCCNRREWHPFIHQYRRDFDCVQLRTDGESAIALMRDELDGLGVVVDTCGPGQHVPVIERKIQDVKTRVRAHCRKSVNKPSKI